MTDIFNHYSELDPTLEAAQIEAKVGSPVFDKWSYLDEARFNAQAAAALGGTLDLPALLDPTRARVEFEAMAAADTGGGGGGDYIAPAVHFDTSVVLRGSLTGSDSPLFAMSGWGRGNGAGVTLISYFQSGTGASTIYVQGGGNGSVNWFITDASGNLFAGANSVETFTSFEHLHILFGGDFSDADPANWKTALYAGYAGQDDVLLTQTGGFTNGPGPLNISIFSEVMSITDTTGISPAVLGQDFSDFYLYTDKSLLSGSTIPLVTQRIFKDALGKPGRPSDVIAALGTPAILLSGDASSYQTNQGSAGSFFKGEVLVSDPVPSAGPCSVALSGAVAGQAVNYVGGGDFNPRDEVTSEFETTISVNDQIQQTTSTDLTGVSMVVVLPGTLTNATTSPSD